MEHYANLHHRDLEFHISDLVILKLTPQLWKKVRSRVLHQGLVRKYDEPFEVLSRVSLQAKATRVYETPPHVSCGLSKAISF